MHGGVVEGQGDRREVRCLLHLGCKDRHGKDTCLRHLSQTNKRPRNKGRGGSALHTCNGFGLPDAERVRANQQGGRLLVEEERLLVDDWRDGLRDDLRVAALLLLLARDLCE